MNVYFKIAVDKNNKLIDVDDVPNGSNCGAYCPKCRNPLIAHTNTPDTQQRSKRDEPAGYFRHDPAKRVDCSFGSHPETYLHFISKKIIKDDLCMIIKNEPIQFMTVMVEKKIEHKNDSNRHIICDVYAVSATDEINIEIKVYHQKDTRDIVFRQENNLKTVEINLSHLVDEPNLTIDAIRQAISFTHNQTILNDLFVDDFPETNELTKGEKPMNDTEINMSNSILVMGAFHHEGKNKTTQQDFSFSKILTLSENTKDNVYAAGERNDRGYLTCEMELTNECFEAIRNEKFPFYANIESTSKMAGYGKIVPLVKNIEVLKTIEL